MTRWARCLARRESWTQPDAVLLVALVCLGSDRAGTAAAQPAPFNDIGVTMGHWHIVSKDVEANKKLFLAMGGNVHARRQPARHVPGGLRQSGPERRKRETAAPRDSVVNHVGFTVDNVPQRVAQWKAAGVTVLPGNNGRLDEAFVVTPDGVRMEIWRTKRKACPFGMSMFICP